MSTRTDVLDDEKMSRMPDREIDKEKEEDRNSKEVGKMSEKEILSQSAKIIDDDKRDLITDSKSRCILERAEQIQREMLSECKERYAEKFSQIDLSKSNDKSVSQAAKLTIEIQRLESNIERIEKKLNPWTQKTHDVKNETREELKSRVEKDRVITSSGKIEVSPTYIDKISKSRNSSEKSAELVLDVVKYQSVTGMSLSNQAKTALSQLNVKSTDDRKVPKYELEKIVTSKHPEAIRTFYEMGLRIGNEKLRPEQLNNVCRALKEADTRDGRIEVLNRMLSGRIQNVRMTDKDIEKLARSCDSSAREKTQKLERIERTVEKQSLKSELLKEPEKTQEKIADLLVKSTEKQNYDSLREIQKESQRMLEREPEKERKPAELSQDDIRTILLGNAPENLLVASKLGIKFPDGIKLDEEKFQRTVDSFRDTKEKSDVIKLALFSQTLYSERDDSKKVVIGKDEERKTVEKLLDVKLNDRLSFKQKSTILNREMSKEEDRKDIDKKDDIRLDLRGMDAKEAAIAVSRYLGQVCARQTSTSEHGFTGFELRDNSYKRTDVLEQLREARQVIREEKIDIRSMDAKDVALRDRDFINIVNRDPQLLVDIQRLGIPITKSGYINEERLQEKIDKALEYSKMEAQSKDGLFSSNDRVAIIASSWARDNDHHVTLSNSINMNNSRDNDYVKNMAIKFASLDILLRDGEQKHRQNFTISSVRNEHNEALDRYRTTETRFSRELEVSERKIDLLKENGKLLSPHHSELKREVERMFYDEKSRTPSTYDGFDKDMVLSRNFPDYLRCIAELRRESEDKHNFNRAQEITADLYSPPEIWKDIIWKTESKIPVPIPEHISLYGGFKDSMVFLKSEKIDKLSNMMPDEREDRTPFYKPVNENGSLVNNVDITDRLVLLDACCIDIKDALTNWTYTGSNPLMIDARQEILDRSTELQDYLERLFDTRNPLDDRVDAEIVRDYFNGIKYESMTKLDSERDHDPINLSTASNAQLLDYISRVDRQPETEVYKIVETPDHDRVILTKLDEEKTREYIMEKFEGYLNTSWDNCLKMNIPSIGDYERDRQDLSQFERLQRGEGEIKFDDYYKLSVLDNSSTSQLIEPFKLDDSMSALRAASQAGMNISIGTNDRELRPSIVISADNVNKYTLATFHDIQKDGVEVDPSYIEANKIMCQYSSALSEIAKSKDSSEIMDIYRTVSSQVDFFLRSEEYLEKIYHTPNGKEIADDLERCREFFISRVEQYIDINPINIDEQYRDIEYEDVRTSSPALEIDNYPIWTATNMIEIDYERLNIVPELKDYYDGILSIEDEARNEFNTMFPGNDEFSLVYDFKSSQAVIVDSEDSSIIYATFGEDKDGNPSFIPSFDYGEEKGMLMLDFQSSLTELFERVQEYKQEFISEISDREQESQRSIVNTELYSKSVAEITRKIDERDEEIDEARDHAIEHLVLREILDEIKDPHTIATVSSLTISEDEITELLYQIATN